MQKKQEKFQMVVVEIKERLIPGVVMSLQGLLLLSGILLSPALCSEWSYKLGVTINYGLQGSN